MTRNAHRNGRIRRLAMALAGVLVLMPVVRWALDARIDSVYVICMDCGLARSEIDELIEIMRESGKVQSRAELLAAYAATFEALPVDGWSAVAEPVPCRDCAEAVLDAAGVE